MNYLVRVKPKHPTGVRRRGGQTFGLEPVIVSGKDMTDEIRNDPWLTVTEAKGEPKAAPTPKETDEERAAREKADADAKAKADEQGKNNKPVWFGGNKKE